MKEASKASRDESTSRDIITVTEEGVVGRLDELICIKVLEGQPEYGMLFYDKINQKIPEVAPVTIQATKEYLACLWEQHIATMAVSF